MAITKVNIARWTVTEVCDFIKKLPGCSDYVEDFMVQEIDGQALMLLQADHLMSAMSIKLGPALKICEQVDICVQTFSWNKSSSFPSFPSTKILLLSGESAKERSGQELTAGGDWKGAECQQNPGEKNRTQDGP